MSHLFFSSFILDLFSDTVDFIKIIIEIENTFDFEFDDDVLAPGAFQTIQDVYDYIVNIGIGK